MSDLAIAIDRDKLRVEESDSRFRRRSILNSAVLLDVAAGKLPPLREGLTMFLLDFP